MESIEQIKKEAEAPIVESKTEQVPAVSTPINVATKEETKPEEREEGASAAANIVNKELAKARVEVAQTEGFKRNRDDVAARGMKAAIWTEALNVLSVEQQNALQEYILDQEKKKLDYRTKYEKRLVRDEIKAEVYKRKIAATEAMYGQYYKTEFYEDYDDQNNPIKKRRLKNFTTNKFVNQVRVFAAWYKSLEEGVRKIIATTVKILFFGGLIVGAIFGILGIVKWLANSGIIGKITETATENLAQFIG